MLRRELKFYWIALSADFAYMLFVFTVTRLMAENQAGLMALGILGAVSSIGFGLGAPIGGWASDVWGGRRVVAVGAAVQALVLLACIQWHSDHQWFYLYAPIGGASVGLMLPPVISWLTRGGLAQLGPRLQGRRLFRFCLSWNLGMIAGQAAGGWLFPSGPTLPLMVGVVLMLGVLVRTGFPIAAPTPAALPPSETEAAVVPESARTFVYLGWLANVASAMGVSVIIHLFPHLATELEISAPIHGLMVATNRSMVIVTYSLMYGLTFWRYRFSAALLAQLCALTGLMLLAYGRTVPFLLLGLILFALLSGYNYFSSIFYSTTTFDRQRQGLFSGMHEASLAVGFAVGAFGGGLVSLWLGSRAPYHMVALVVLVTTAVQSWVHWKGRKHHAS